MFLIAGLGNPGDKYKNTRHNIGFRVIDKLADDRGISLNNLKFKSVYGQGNIFGKKVFLVKPTTYMNNSGEAIRDIANYYKIETSNIIVVADDIDIPFASIRIRRNGSAGSHNGLKSVVQHLSSKDFPRIKIGVGKKKAQQDLAKFVLSRFTDQEESYIEESVDIASQAILEIINKDINSAMNKYNNRGGIA